MKQHLYKSFVFHSRAFLLAIIALLAPIQSVSIPACAYRRFNIDRINGGNWGFVNKSGQLVIPPQFDSSGIFSEGSAFVKWAAWDDFRFAIDRNGKKLFNTKFQNGPSKFSQGRAAVCGRTEPIAQQAFIEIPARKISFIDHAGKKWGAFYDKCSNFREGKALVTSDVHSGKYSVLTQTGKTLFTLNSPPCQFEFSEGLLPARSQGKCGFVNSEGKFVIAPVYHECRSFAEGLAAVSVEIAGEERWGFIDHQGSLKIPLRFKLVSDFSDGMASYSEAGALNGLLDKSGKIILPLSHTTYGPFSEGLARFSESGQSARYGFVDKTGKKVLSSQYADAGSFKEGACPVAVKVGTVRKYGFIDHKGIWVIRPEFSSALEFSEGLAAVRVFPKESP